MEKKKYSLEYFSGSTGFGWKEEYDTIKEPEEFINRMEKENHVGLILYDRQLGDFIYWKDPYYYPSIDLLHSRNRDLRTKTRKYTY